MRIPGSPLALALLLGMAASLPCRADSLASSASLGGSASSGSLSDSVHDSSHSSKRTLVEGDYRIVDVAAAERPETLRLKLQHLARTGDEDGVIYLDVPQAALGDRTATVGDVVGVRQRPYGYEFAWADTREAFFLALSEDWLRDLEPRLVHS